MEAFQEHLKKQRVDNTFYHQIFSFKVSSQHHSYTQAKLKKYITVKIQNFKTPEMGLEA